MSQKPELYSLTRQIKDYLVYMSSLGLQEIPRLGVEAPPGIGSQGKVVDTLEQIQGDLVDCRRCGLCRERNHIVFGEGPHDADIMFVGEGPGADEDRTGRPFVGKAGQLLTDIIVKGMKMRREDCYIANIVKCRPPDNREPQPEEALTCLPFLRRQIAVIRPKVICALGRTAAQYLLDTSEPLGRLRHRFHDLEGIPVMPTYHPSALLRDPGRKRDAWEDIKLVMQELTD